MIGTGTEPRVGSPDAAGAINHPRSTVALVCPTASRPSRSRSAKKPCAEETRGRSTTSGAAAGLNARDVRAIMAGRRNEQPHVVITAATTRDR